MNFAQNHNILQNKITENEGVNKEVPWVNEKSFEPEVFNF